MIKETIKHILKLLGYSVTRNITPSPNGVSIVKVGKFDVQINNNNGIKYCYEYCKDYGTQLSRLSSFLINHYPQLEVIDIGANLGDSIALIKSGADVPVTSIEGDISLIDLFKFNTAQFKNVTLLKIFLSDRETELDCVFSKVGHNLTITPTQKSKYSVVTQFSTIDILYENLAINDNCKLLKIDTEGFDLKIMRGGREFLNTVKPVILFEFNRDNLSVTEIDPFSIFSWLLDQNYNKILFYECDGRFMFSTNLHEQNFIRQLYDYIDGKNAKIYYMDIIVFHVSDNELATDFINLEEKHRSPTE